MTTIHDDARSLLLEVYVLDQGIGMNQEELEHVFDPFWRSTDQRSQSMNSLGNGVGLSICKQICESLGGSISVLSKPGSGSQFRFTMKVFSHENNAVA